MDRTESTALLEGAKAGSGAALNALFERCAGRLLALIRLRMIGCSFNSCLEAMPIAMPGEAAIPLILSSFALFGMF